MRILYVCHEPLPSASTSTEQLMKAAAAMANTGMEVVVSTPTARDVPSPEFERLVSDFYGIDDTLFGHGLEIRRLPAPRFVGGGAVRPWHDIGAARFGARENFDVLYVRDPVPLVTALFTRRPVVFETYRYDLSTRIGYGPWRAFCYSRPGLLGVVTHSDVARQSLLRAGIAEDRLLVAHNGFEPRGANVVGQKDARRSLQLAEQGSYVVYAGGVSEAKGLESLLPAAAALPETEFLVVGHEPGSTGEARFRSRIGERGLTNVRMIERVAPSAVDLYLAAADCLFIPTSGRPLYRSGRTVLPIKTFRYLAAGRPIVAPDLHDLREVLKDGHNALLVKPDQPDETVAAVRSVLEDHALAGRLSDGAMASAVENTWDSRAQRIAAFIGERLAVGGRGSPD